jgi:hypothetical protein
MKKKMDLAEEKIKLARVILSVESKQLIAKIKSLIKNEAGDLWDELHEDVKADVLEAEKQLERGEGVSHSMVMERYEKWVKK